ncbi:MAG: hypothetical protein FWC64_02720 [Treponema sp.]|nr:hypothetical protein [Treponema sp.]
MISVTTEREGFTIGFSVGNRIKIRCGHDRSFIIRKLPSGGFTIEAARNTDEKQFDFLVENGVSVSALKEGSE